MIASAKKGFYNLFRGNLSIKKSRMPRTPVRKVFRCTCETLESRLLLSTVSWVAGLSGDWDTKSDWSTGQVPNGTQDVIISAPGTYTITHNVGDSDSFKSLTVSNANVLLDVTSGSLTQTGASNSVSTVDGTLILNGVTFSVTGGTFTASGSTTLTNTDLSATTGGQMAFPKATTFTTDANTIQASGTGSEINLSDLSTLTNDNIYGDSSSISPTTGGDVILAGNITGPITLTLSDTVSTFNVAAVSSLNSATVDAGPGTFNFSGATSLNNVNLRATSAGQILFPIATTFTTDANTIDATGTGSKINLPDLATLTNDNIYGDSSSISPTTGGDVILAGNITGPITLTLSDTTSTFNVAGVSSLNSATVDTGPGTFNFSGTTSLNNVNLGATSAGQILFPVATTFTTDANTIDATGTGSKINLSDLATLTNDNIYGDSSSISPTTGATIILAGNITGPITLTLSDTTSTFNVAGVSSLNSATVNTGPGTFNFSGATSLNNVNLSATSGGQILFPIVTTFTTDANTIQATGTGSKITLPDLSTLTNDNFFGDSSSISPTTGATIILAGNITGPITLTLADIASTFNVSAVSSLNSATVDTGPGTFNFSGTTSLNNVNLSATSAGQILFPVATTFTTDANTIEATGTGSKITLPDLSTLTNDNFFGDSSSISPTTGATIILAGNITGPITLILSDTASTFNVSAVNSLNSATVDAGPGTFNFSGVTSLNNVNLSATSGGQILFPIATTFTTDANTIQATGTGTEINLSDLATVTNDNFFGDTSSFVASTGGVILVAGQMSGPQQFTSTGAGALLVLEPGLHIYNIPAPTISGGGTIDITNNEILINYGSGSDPISTIASAIKSGYNNGGWNGAGIISSLARTPTNGLHYGVGYADANDAFNPANLPSGEIKIVYTLLGDANLDGTVNGSDFSLVAAFFGMGVQNWDDGDFNYAGAVNGTDFADLAANFGQGTSLPSVSPVLTTESTSDPASSPTVHSQPKRNTTASTYAAEATNIPTPANSSTQTQNPGIDSKFLAKE